LLAEVAAYVTDAAGRKLQAAARELARRTSSITFSGPNIAKREYRFIWETRE
jgi:hypothetical protein